VSCVLFITSEPAGCVAVACPCSVIPIAPREIVELPFFTPLPIMPASVFWMVLSIGLVASTPPCVLAACELSLPTCP